MAGAVVPFPAGSRPTSPGAVWIVLYLALAAAAVAAWVRRGGLDDDDDARGRKGGAR